MKKLLILFVMAFAINVAAQESVLLRLNYKKGDSYVMKMKMTQDMGEVMSMDMNMTMNQDITSVTSDAYVAVMKIARVSTDINQQGIRMSYDSSKTDEETDETGMAMKAQMEPMLKAVITLKGNNVGEVLETSVEPNTPGTSELTKQSNNVVYPENALKVGDIWKMTKSNNGMNMNFIYKVKSITKNVVLLDISGNVGGMAEGTITGDMKVDRKSGVPLISNVNMNMSVQGQEMITKMTVTMTKQ